MAGSEKYRTQTELADAPIPGLLLKLSVPSILGLLALTICQIIDTIFVGRYVGIYGIGGIGVVIPVVLLFSSIGRGLGVGGASIISRSFGNGLIAQAKQTLSLVIALWLLFSLIFLIMGVSFADPLLRSLGGNGQTLVFSQQYFLFLLPGLPCLSFAMLSNSLMRGEGQAAQAMLVLVVPALVNLLLDPLFIVYFGWGMKGAAAATSVAYFCSALFSLWHFVYGNSKLRISADLGGFRWPLAKQVLALALTPIACQCLTALVAVVMNRTLFVFGGELAIASYSIVQRFYMFVLFPLIGISQGFSPICGYSYGAGNAARLKDLISLSVKTGLLVATLISLLTLLLNEQIASIFTLDLELIRQSSFAIKTMVMLLPLVAVQLICAVYFQTLGLAFQSLLLTLLRQGLILIPLILVLPHFFGINGIWYAYPVANLLACVISLLLVFPKWQHLFQTKPQIIPRLSTQQP